MTNKSILLMILVVCTSFADSCDIDLDTILIKRLCTALNCSTNTILCSYISKAYDTSDQEFKMEYKIIKPILGKFEINKNYTTYEDCFPDLKQGEKVIVFEWKNCWFSHGIPLTSSSYFLEAELLRLVKVCKYFLANDMVNFNKIATKKENDYLRKLNKSDLVDKLSPEPDKAYSESILKYLIKMQENAP
jgi:hypothetical protein